VTTLQALEIHKRFVAILKKRFTNLAAQELSDIASALCTTAVTVLEEKSV
jgi:hypothetical protein